MAGHLLPISTDRFFEDTERIELRIYGAGAGRFETELRKRMAHSGMNPSQRRVFDRVVLVTEDGEEKKLIE